MSLETRKLELMQQLLLVDSEEVLERMQDMLNAESTFVLSDAQKAELDEQNSSSELDDRIVKQALSTEEEIEHGKGHTPPDEQTFMNDGFKALALKTKGLRFKRAEANSR